MNREIKSDTYMCFSYCFATNLAFLRSRRRKHYYFVAECNTHQFKSKKICKERKILLLVLPRDCGRCNERKEQKYTSYQKLFSVEVFDRFFLLEQPNKDS